MRKWDSKSVVLGLMLGMGLLFMAAASTSEQPAYVGISAMPGGGYYLLKGTGEVCEARPDGSYIWYPAPHAPMQPATAPPSR